MRVSQLFNTLLFTQQQQEQQQQQQQQQQEEQEEQEEVRVSQLFNTLLFTQEQEEVSSSSSSHYLHNDLSYPLPVEGLGLLLSLQSLEHAPLSLLARH